MSTPESIAAAFARGLMEAMLQGGEKPKKERPQVIAKDHVREAVAAEVRRLLEEESPPSAPQMDLFTRDIENAPIDPVGEAIARRVDEARARADAQDDERDPPGTWRPDLPEGSPWISPIADR